MSRNIPPSVKDAMNSTSTVQIKSYSDNEYLYKMKKYETMGVPFFPILRLINLMFFMSFRTFKIETCFIKPKYYSKTMEPFKH